MESKNPENLLIRYLLGELSESESDALETRFLSDDETLEQVQAVEYELIDRYVRELMPATQRARFESYYLATPLHRERVATARELLHAADEKLAASVLMRVNAVVSVARPSWWQSLFTLPTFAWSGALAVALLGALVIWLLLERRSMQTQLQAQQQQLHALEIEIAQHRSTVATMEQMLAQRALTPSPMSALTLNDGGKLLALNAQGQLQGAEGFNEQEQTWLRQTLQAERLPTAPTWMDLRTTRDGLMGNPTTELSFKLKQPFGQALLTTTPTFRWEALPAAESYRVDIYDMKYQLVFSSEKMAQTTWQANHALPAGQMYQWQVTALRQGQEVQAPAPPAPPARFAVVAANEAAAIEQARRKQPAAHLLLSTLYARNGLYAEAEHELRLLQKANPDNAQVKQILAELNRRVHQSAPTKTKPAQ